MSRLVRGHASRTSTNCIKRASVACIAVVASVLTLVIFAGAAAAATPCGTQVLADWSDNGQIDRVYDLHCYEEAVDAIPSDLRDYTNAAEVIERALTSALRSRQTSGEIDGPRAEAVPDVEASGASSVPIVPVVGGGLALALLAAGALAYVSRRRRRAS